MNSDQPIDSELGPELRTTQRWVETFVVGKGLCPFAAPELKSQSLRFALSQAQDTKRLLEDLAAELQRLLLEEQVGTTLLVHPWVLTEFAHYNQFLDAVDELLAATNLEGVVQVASFHPSYQFADAAADAAENYTNRSPYPMLHLLPEAKVAQAVASFESVGEISVRNIEQLRALGSTAVAQEWRACFEPS